METCRVILFTLHERSLVGNIRERHLACHGYKELERWLVRQFLPACSHAWPTREATEPVAVTVFGFGVVLSSMGGHLLVVYGVFVSLIGDLNHSQPRMLVLYHDGVSIG